MKSKLAKSFAIIITGATVAGAHAQLPSPWDICFDPENDQPRSIPYITQSVANNLMGCVMGISGTITYGGANGPCFVPAEAIDIAGRISLFYGPIGSGQRTSPNFNDNFMGLTFGAPNDPAWTYFATSVDGVLTRWGGGIGTTFVGFSNRYMSATSTDNGVQARLQVEIVADAVRFRWNLTNTDDEPHAIGLYFGGAPMMFQTSGGNSNPESGSAVTSGFGPNKQAYVVTDKGRPPRTDVSYDRNLDASGFPTFVDFFFGQTDALGFRLENSPSASTEDVANNRPATADGFWLGKANFLLDTPSGTDPFPRAMLPDTGFLSSVAFVQRFPERTVAAASSYQLVHYARSTWGTSDYKLPYGVAVDSPKLISATISGNSGNPELNGLTPNPVPMRVYVDNVGGYAFDGREFPLNDVRVKVAFAPTAGVTLAGANPSRPYERELSIPVVNPQQLQFVDFSATVSANTVGVVPYTVTIDSQPGNVRKVIEGSLTIAAQSRIQLYPDANMIGLPFDFQNTSLDAIFAPFEDPNVPGGDLQYYKYDPQQGGYTIINSAPRGEAFFVIYKKTGASPVFANYAGRPSGAGQFLDGAPLIQLRRGFNMISNPYNYRIPINQIVGVSASAFQEGRFFKDIVDLGYVQSFLTTWNPVTKDYEFVSAEDGFLEPHRGYWIQVLSLDDLTINYPPVYSPGLLGQSRRPTVAWPQTNEKWRLKLSARSGDSVDSENYVANVDTAQAVKRTTVSEPPMSPIQEVSLSIEQSVNGTPTRMAQAATEKSGRTEWNVVVQSKKAGDVTVTWPNLGTLPKNLRLRVTDPATNITRSLRQTSGYTFKMDQPGTRTLKLSVEPGGETSAAVIGNVVVSSSGRGATSVTVNYTLGAEATTSVRILSATGKEVYSVTRGRADRAGENSVVWNLRNSANQAVAPGSYRVEIVAESESGERVRKTAVVNVIR